MRYKVITYGCQMNWSDSERIAAVLDQASYRPATTKQVADLFIFNACSVRQSAIDRVYGQINNCAKLTTPRRPLLILTGCVLEKDQQKLANKLDLILNIKSLARWPKIIEKYLDQHAQTHITIPRDTTSYLRLKPSYQTNFRAYVPISTGCNNYCTYCVVPYARGAEKNRPAKDILKEVRSLIKNDYKEIWLLGQNVNSYKSKIGGPLAVLRSTLQAGRESRVDNRKSKTIDFADLLQIINDLPGEFRIKFMSSHPKDMSDKLIATVASSSKVCRYIHLPVQSGNNEILKKMNRRYTVEYYKKLIRKIRRAIPTAAISTDIIVGFPGETKKQFCDTTRLMRQIGFDMAYLSQYSPRPQTAAARFKDNISKSEKVRREYILNEILKKAALENNQKHIDYTEEVLVDSLKNSYALGKTRSEKSVRFLVPKKMKSASLIGQIIKVEIVGAISWGLEGKVKISGPTPKVFGKK